MMVAGSRSSTIYDFVAPPLILATPFISFINHNDYSYTAPEFWLCLAGLIVLGLLCGAVMALGGVWFRVLGTAGLVTLFVDLQFDWLDTMPYLRVSGFLLGAVGLCWLTREHLSRIASLVFATMLASTVALPTIDDAAPAPSTELGAGDQGAATSEPPTVVHIVLDEHIGIEGIPTDVQGGRETKAMLKSFYRTYGFRLFGHAYSRYYSTRDAVPNMLNYTSESLDRSLVDGDRAVALKSNKYFQDMYRVGYEIHAFQIAWLNLCKTAEEIIASCYTEDHTGIKALQAVDFSLDKKTFLIYQLYSGLSVINRAFRYWNNMVHAFAERNGWSWPEWWLQGEGMPAIRAMYSLSVLGDEVARSGPGQLFFAHVLIPHSPYIYDRRCEERDPAEWDHGSDDKPLPPNTVDSRARRYALYLEQVSCVQVTLQKMFDGWRRAGVYDRMKIIIQGDHGSRIFLNKPNVPNKDRLVASDYIDAFSTLLAVKAPGVEPAYDTRMVAIQDQLEALVHGQPLGQVPANDARPYVLLNDGGDMIRQPMADFGGPSREEHRLHLSGP